MDWLAFGFGIAIVAGTWASLVSTFVLPRGRSRLQLVALIVGRMVRGAFVVCSRAFADFAKKDGLLAMIGPATLLSQLAVFLGLFVAGYGLAMVPFVDTVGSAFRDAGSSVFVVGINGATNGSNDVLAVLAAATGAIAIALQIGYLPTIYQSFNRREALVTLLESRAGVPAWGPELLMRHQLVHSIDALNELYAAWEDWAAEVAESHVSYPVLTYFRSPEPWYSWILALLAVLDGAAMHLAVSPASAPSQARVCLRMGFTSLRRIAAVLRIPFEPDPLPEHPIELGFDDFAHAWQLLEQSGFPVERSATEAWPDFKGWRVNYESIAYRIADRVVAPRAPWSGGRRSLAAGPTMPTRPPHRAPGAELSPRPSDD